MTTAEGIATPQGGTRNVDGKTEGSAAKTAWGERWAIPLFFAAVAGWVGYLWVDARIQREAAEGPAVSMVRMRDALAAKDYERVERDAAVLFRDYRSWALQGEVQLMAAHAAYESGAANAPRGSACFERACALAQRALGCGLSETRAADAFEVLARSDAALGDWRQTLAVLADFARRNRIAAQSLDLLKAEAEFRSGNVNAGRATVDSVLHDSGLTNDRWESAHLVLGDGLRMNGILDGANGAEDAYRKITDTFPKSARIKDANFGIGMVVLERSRKSPELRDSARRWFESVLSLRAAPRDEIDRRAAFYVAECRLGGGDAPAAPEAFRRVVSSWPGTPEAIAASLRLASLDVTQGRFDAAREALGTALDQAGDDGRLETPYVSAPEVNSLWRAVMKHFLDAREYESLDGLNGDASKLARRDVYRMQLAELLRHHARSLRLEASKALREKGAPGSREAAALEDEARIDFRRAAESLLAVVRGVDAEKDLYERALRTAADSLFESGAWAEAVVYYRMFLAGHPDASGSSERLHLARALQAMGRHAEAVADLDLIIGRKGSRGGAQASGDSNAWDALLVRAESYRALGAWDNAEQAFEDILCRPDYFRSQGRVWRQALAEAGYSHYRAGRFREAALRFDEALDRSGASDGSSDAPFSRAQVCYWLADSWRSINSSDPASRREELAAAAKRFAEVRSETDAREPSVREAQLRRLSLGAEAECRYALGDWRGALAIYRAAAEKYLDAPDGVGALYGAAACLNRMGDRVGADQTLKRARWCHERLRREHSGELNAFLEDSWKALASWQTASSGQ